MYIREPIFHNDVSVWAKQWDTNRLAKERHKTVIKGCKSKTLFNFVYEIIKKIYLQ